MIFAENDIGAADKNDILYLKELNEKLKKTPHDYDTLLRKALLLYYPFYRTNEAGIIFELLAQLYPYKYDVYFWHGESLYVCVANYEKAATLLRKAISIDKNRADGYVLLAQTLNMMDDSYQQEMECLLKQALKLEPRWPNAWYGLISLFITQNRFDEARQIIKEAFHHIPLSYTHSDDIIQGRHDELVSGRSWTPCMKDDLQEYLQSIKIEEAKIKKSNE